MGSSSAVRTWLQRQLQSSGIQIESAALKLLAKSLDELTSRLSQEGGDQQASPERLLSALLDDVETRTDDRKLTVSFVEAFLQRWVDGNQDTTVEVISAFDVPLVQYDPIRHQWFRQKSARSIVGDIKNKTQLYEDRFLLIQQRLKRNALFRPSKWASGAGSSKGGAAGRAFMHSNQPSANATGASASFNAASASASASSAAELIELKALLGHERQRRVDCGFLTKHEEGQYFIEDLSARLPIDLSGCDAAEGLFTENCVVVAEGELQPSGEFRAMALGLPPAESREESIDALQGHDMFGGRATGQYEEDDARDREDDGDRIVVLSDVHLDDPRVLENLDKVFDGFSAGADVTAPPSAFVLIGNFQTFDANGPRSKLSKLKENFTRLGRLLKGYPRIVSESQIVLVPGPNDIGTGTALPRRGIPLPLIEGLRDVVPGVIMASNPCRIRFRGAELAFFRSNLQQKLRGLCILPPPMPQDDDADLTVSDAKRQQSHASFFFDQTCSTVIQESHLCPVPLEYQPIAWEFDHAMYIYPNPHGLILADSEPAARSIFDTCDCLNPGSLATGTFGAWNPASREMELCDVNAAMAGGEDAEDADEDDDFVALAKDVDEAVEDAVGDVVEVVEVVEEGVVGLDATAAASGRAGSVQNQDDSDADVGPGAEAEMDAAEDERTAAERYDELLAEVGLSDEDEEGDPAEEFENDVFTLPDED